MKSSLLFLLLLSLISNVYSLDTTSSTTRPPKALPKKTTTNPIKTHCSTETNYSIISTGVPLKTVKSSVPVYTAASPSYTKICRIGIEGCEKRGSILYPLHKKAAKYVPIPCKNVQLSESEDVVAIASLSQYDKFVPKDEIYENGWNEADTTLTQQPVYVIHEKTLYCYNKQTYIKTIGGLKDFCNTSREILSSPETNTITITRTITNKEAVYTNTVTAP
eukprot:jgi/Orpsp1_1/1175676/evm.model.c7180000054782.1